MPRRDDISSVLIIGSGPIVIGQAAEFDYSGTQACHALRDEGYRVILVNSNPATIMTDPEVADATYVEPLTTETVTEILRRERPDALLPTLGGQTALNLAVELNETGILDDLEVELLGASIQSIHKAEDRQLFHDAMRKVGLQVPQSRTVKSFGQAEELVSEADPERRDLTEQRTQGVDRRSEGGRVAWAVREEEPIRLCGEDLLRCG